jgi:hypothetical protein
LSFHSVQLGRLAETLDQYRLSRIHFLLNFSRSNKGALLLFSPADELLSSLPGDPLRRLTAARYLPIAPTMDHSDLERSPKSFQIVNLPLDEINVNYIQSPWNYRR